jgi:hypothetical protein
VRAHFASILLGSGLAWLATGAWAEPSAPDPATDPQSSKAARGGLGHLLDNEWYKLSLDLRGRIELAHQEGRRSSQAYTVRTRLGIGTKPFHGFSAFVEGQNMFSFADGRYFDGVSEDNGRTLVADPEATRLNRLFLRYQNAKLADLDLNVGRQRINLDDQRFIGNVGWRQNEQVFDAARVESSLGVEGLSAGYAYLDQVLRIFGDKGAPSRRDFDSRSHLIRVRHDELPGGIALTGFAYLLGFDQSPVDSSNSYGFRLDGSRVVAGGLHFDYVGSYAYQTDARNNPVSYGAHYLNLEGRLGTGSLGSVKLGYELLGSDAGRARFVTPLATAHKFNGWADAFLDNGGVDGLQEIYLSLSPALPFELKGSVRYHHYWSDEGGRSLGDEIDFEVFRQFGRHYEVRTKGAWFEGTSDGPASRWRFWLEFTIRY